MFATSIRASTLQLQSTKSTTSKGKFFLTSPWRIRATAGPVHFIPNTAFLAVGTIQYWWITNEWV
jgi:hypothetical protein